MRWLSKSKSNRPRRVLLVYGRGPVAAAGQFLPAFFVQAGFEVRCALTADAIGWVGPETLRFLSRSSVLLPSAALPGWASQNVPFGVSITVGLSPAELVELVCGTPTAPALQLISRFGGSCFAALESPPSPQIRSLLQSSHAGLFPFPAAIGDMQRAFEGLFGCVVASLEAQYRCSHLVVRLHQQVPEPLTHLTGEPCGWQRDLHSLLRRSGMQVHATNTSPGAPTPSHLDLEIELYGGPWVQRASRRTSNPTIAFDPQFAAPLPAGAWHLRFIDTRVSQEARDALVSERVWLASPLATGDVLLQNHHGSRLIPDLPERPALARLVELLTERLSGSR